MRKIITTIACAGVVFAAAGCGGSESTSSTSAPTSVTPGTAGISQLRDIWQHAQDSRKTVVVTLIPQQGGPDNDPPEVCKTRFTDPKGADCVIHDKDGEFHTIGLTDLTYTATPDPTTDGKKWRKTDTHGSDPTARMRSDSMLPSSVTGTVRAGVPDQLGGKAATRFDIEFDVKAMFQSMASRLGGHQGIDQDLTKLGDTATGQIWIDGDNLPAQAVMKITLKDLPPQTITIKYSDWGTPVDIAAPPADQVGK